MVVVTPDDETRRMRWLPVSATTSSPVEGTKATDEGRQNLAEEPVPSAKDPKPTAANPASVDTPPVLAAFGAATSSDMARSAAASLAAPTVPCPASPAAPHSSAAE